MRDATTPPPAARSFPWTEKRFAAHCLRAWRSGRTRCVRPRQARKPPHAPRARVPRGVVRERCDRRGSRSSLHLAVVHPARLEIRERRSAPQAAKLQTVHRTRGARAAARRRLRRTMRRERFRKHRATLRRALVQPTRPEVHRPRRVVTIAKARARPRFVRARRAGSRQKNATRPSVRRPQLRRDRAGVPAVLPPASVHPRRVSLHRASSAARETSVRPTAWPTHATRSRGDRARATFQAPRHRRGTARREGFHPHQVRRAWARQANATSESARRQRLRPDRAQVKTVPRSPPLERPRVNLHRVPSGARETTVHPPACPAQATRTRESRASATFQGPRRRRGTTRRERFRKRRAPHDAVPCRIEWCHPCAGRAVRRRAQPIGL